MMLKSWWWPVGSSPGRREDALAEVEDAAQVFRLQVDLLVWKFSVQKGQFWHNF